MYVRTPETPEWRQALLLTDWLRRDPAERDAYAAAKPDPAKKNAWLDDALTRAEAWASETGWTP